MPLANLTIELDARLAKLQEGMARAEQISQGTANAIEAHFGALKSLAAGLGASLAGAFTIDALATFTRANIDALDALNDVADATGASIENLSALEDVARRNGGTLDGVAGILVKFNAALNEADGKNGVSQALKAIGVDAKELRSQDPAEALRRVAVALSGFADDGNKARLVQELFGKSIREAAPFLKDLAEAGRLNATATSEQALRAEKLNKAISELETNASNAARTLVAELAPALNKLLHGDIKGGAIGVFDRLGESIGFGKDYYEFRNKVKQQMEDVKDLAGVVETLQGLIEKDPTNLGLQEKLMQRAEELRAAELHLHGAYDSVFGAASAGRARANKDEAPSLPSLPALANQSATKKDPALGAIRSAQEQYQADFLRMEKAFYTAREDNATSGLGAIRDAEEQYKNDFLRSEKASYDEIEKYTSDTQKRMEEFAQHGRERIQDALGDGLYDALSGNFDHIGRAFGNMIERLVAESLAADIMGKLFGKTGTGTGGDASALTSLFALFGGHRASGGPVEAGRVYEVTEGGRPELFGYEGRQYLLNGKSDGYVRPLGHGGSGGGGAHFDLSVSIGAVGEGVSESRVFSIVRSAQQQQEVRMRRLQREGQF